MRKSKIIWLSIMTFGLVGAIIGTIIDIVNDGISITSVLSICFCVMLGLWWVNYYRYDDMFAFNKKEAKGDEEEKNTN